MRKHDVRSPMAGGRLVVAAATALAIGALVSGPLADEPDVVGALPTWERYCGNGVAEPGEECDPGNSSQGIPPDLRELMCEGKGFTGGELACTSQCELDDSGCYCHGGTSFPATGQRTCWDSGSPHDVIDCANTGHDGDIRAGAPLSYTDNGDGTITDHNTLLMWQKNDASGGIHDKDNRYTWWDASTIFVDALNNTCEGDGVVRCDSEDLCGAGGQCGFAGYRDWRVPNVKELQSIVDYQVTYPAVSAEFNTNCVSGCTVLQCSCTGGSSYWSSSSYAHRSYFAWYVHFNRGGFVGTGDKYDDNSARAVRGGS